MDCGYTRTDALIPREELEKRRPTLVSQRHRVFMKAKWQSLEMEKSLVYSTLPPPHRLSSGPLGNVKQAETKRASVYLITIHNNI